MDGRWSEWTAWSECDARCGGGVSQRSRSCSAPPPKNGGRGCEGMTLQTRSCHRQPCTQDGGADTGGVSCRTRQSPNEQEVTEMFVQAALRGWCWSPRPTAGTGGRSLVFQRVLSSAPPPPARRPVKRVRKEAFKERGAWSRCAPAEAVLAPPGCRCPHGSFLQGGRCVNASQCFCPWDGRRLQPGQAVSGDHCTTWWETQSLDGHPKLRLG